MSDSRVDNVPAGPEAPADLIHRIAAVTRMLRENMRELGLDQAIKDAAHAIPDARDRLHYVARMTEQAATRVLNAAEEVQPWQQSMQSQAEALDARWKAWFDHPVELDSARALVDDTRTLLADIPVKTRASQDNLMEIIMAQDFQDLTGQVITKMLGVIGAIESELVQVLIDNAPQDRREDTVRLINGPVVATDGRSDIVTSQDQVDDLLANLGF